MVDFTGFENAKPCPMCHRCLTTDDVCDWCKKLQACRSGAAEMAKWLESNRVEINALRAHVERATEVIEKVKRMYDHPTGADADWGSLLCANAIAKTAVNEFVAATPAQSLAEIKAAALREVAKLIRQTTPDPVDGMPETFGEHEGRMYAIEQIESEADRIETEAANG